MIIQTSERTKWGVILSDGEVEVVSADHVDITDNGQLWFIHGSWKSLNRITGNQQ